MADTISLRAYIARLDDLLRTNATDEVIHHCRHILQYFPRNVAAYRILGTALLNNSRIDEARAVFQRVLGVHPDDFAAHVGLSEIYDRKGRANDAIWHLERAYEQNPTNARLIENLRELYKRHERVEQARFQLTAAAVARQYARNGLNERAVETLRGALERASDRLDLRLLLAETLWENDQRIEAAETALDVLELLPDCLSANRILSEFWLAEERPSDAQRFMSHLEGVDPYLALELATGLPTADDAFTLEELDYRSYAQRELATSSPDWLQELDDSGFGTTSADILPPAPAKADDDWKDWLQPQPAAGESGDDEPLQEVKRDWLNEIEAIRSQEGVKVSTQDMPAFPESFDDKIDFPIEPSEPTTVVTARDMKRETATRANIFEQKAEPTDELPEWLKQTEPPPEVFGDEPPLPRNLDAFAWLRETDIEFDENAEPPEGVFFRETESLPGESEPADPVAWMRERGIEVGEAGEPAPYDPFETADEAPITDPAADPLGWMRQYGDLMTPEAEAPAPAKASPAAADDEDPFAWMHEHGVELVDEQPSDSPVRPDDRTRAALNMAAFEQDPLDWLQDDSLLEGVVDGDVRRATSMPTERLEDSRPQETAQAQNTEASILDEDLMDALRSSIESGDDFADDTDAPSPVDAGDEEDESEPPFPFFRDEG